MPLNTNRSPGDQILSADINAIAAQTNSNESAIANLGGTSSTTAVGRTGRVTVASSVGLSTAQRDACDFKCSGTNDQIEINAALLRASRPGDGFGGQGQIGVELVGPSFFTGNSTAGAGTGAIAMYPSTKLWGNGPGTLISPRWATNVDRGCIELLNGTTAHVSVSDLTIGEINVGTNNGLLNGVFNGHGVKFEQTGDADNYEIKTGSDPFQQVQRVTVLKPLRNGFWFTGTSGGNRETQVHNCLAWQAQERGFWFDGSSDCQISDCRSTGGGNFARFDLGGGNVKAANCKAYFSGNQDAGEGPTADGFLLSSSRVEIVGCSAQDNGRHGFNITSSNVTAGDLVSDSNGRALNSVGVGAGFLIAGNGMYSGLNAHNRPQNTVTQNKGIIFSGNPQVFLTARVELESILNGPGTHVTGAVTGYVRVLKASAGATDAAGVYSVG